MTKKQVLKSISFSALALMTFAASQPIVSLADTPSHVATTTQAVSVQPKVHQADVKQVTAPLVQADPASPEYIEVGTEAEFRNAVASDNGKTYIKLTANIELLEGQVEVPASKASLTIDGSWTSQTGDVKNYMLKSGHPIFTGIIPVPAPPSVPTAQQKMLYINNANTKSVTLTHVAAVTSFMAGVVDVADSQSDVTVNLDHTDVHGPMGVINHNGVVNITGKASVRMDDTFNDITIYRARGLAEANTINVAAELDVNDLGADDDSRRSLFRTMESKGFSGHITMLPNSRITTPDNQVMQSFVMADSGQAVLTMMKDSVLDIDILDDFSEQWDLSNLVLESGSHLTVRRTNGEHTPNTSSRATVSVTKGFTAKKGSSVDISNLEASSVTGAVIELGNGAILDIERPEQFKLKNKQTAPLFSAPQGGTTISIDAANSLQGWNDTDLEVAPYIVAGPLQAVYSLYQNNHHLVSSSVDDLEAQFPISTLHQLLVD